MAKSFIYLIMAFLLLSTAQTRPLSTNNGQQADNPQTPFSQKLQESSYIDDVCKGLDGEDCPTKPAGLCTYAETGCWQSLPD
ncbi:hypothetical protein V6N11_067828 [Hibiscus sabdariffa]|uniref:Phytosulfokine-beta n=1 Tax=Hibiscus sabdariffa TaxID=183260 RepID=A0ABR2SSV9_9ROSI